MVDAVVTLDRSDPKHLILSIAIFDDYMPFYEGTEQIDHRQGTPDPSSYEEARILGMASETLLQRIIQSLGREAGW